MELSPRRLFNVSQVINLLSVEMDAITHSLKILPSREHLHPTTTGQQMQRYCQIEQENKKVDAES